MGNWELGIGNWTELLRRDWVEERWALALIRPVCSMSNFVHPILIFIYNTFDFAIIIDRVSTPIKNIFLLPIIVGTRQCRVLNVGNINSDATRFDVNSQFPIPNSQFPMPNSQFPIPDSQFPIPNSRFPIPNSRFPIPNSRFPIPDSLFPIPHFE